MMKGRWEEGEVLERREVRLASAAPYPYWWTDCITFEVVKMAQPCTRRGERLAYFVRYSGRYMFGGKVYASSRKGAMAALDKALEMIPAHQRALDDGPVNARREYAPQWLA
jgi:hypothetical protein